MKDFAAGGLPLLIGSLPMDDHAEATKLVLKYTPDIPLWVQLPSFKEEGMISQFMGGMPGFMDDPQKNMLDTSRPGFDQEMIDYFESYLHMSASGGDLTSSRFALSGNRGKGFFEFLKQIDESPLTFKALKGQVTGPVTFGTAVKDKQNKDIFYNDQLRDAAIKMLALNAKWQASEFTKRGAVPIIFIDEPALAGIGTSAYMTITKEDVTGSIDEIAMEIHAQDGLAGVHVCANTQWDMLLNSSIDVISFDAFSYFDRFILFPDDIHHFLKSGKFLAWGIIPTTRADLVASQTVESLAGLLNNQMEELSEKIRIDKDTIIRQTFITPSCGAGSIDLASAKKVLALTKSVSAAIRN